MQIINPFGIIFNLGVTRKKAGQAFRSYLFILPSKTLSIKRITASILYAFIKFQQIAKRLKKTKAFFCSLSLYNKVTKVIAIATTLVFYVPLAPLTNGTRLRQHGFVIRVLLLRLLSLSKYHLSKIFYHLYSNSLPLNSFNKFSQ